MRTISETKLRDARRTADAARRDGLVDRGPARVGLAVEVIELIEERMGGTMDGRDIDFVEHLLTFSRTALQLYPAEARRAKATASHAT